MSDTWTYACTTCGLQEEGVELPPGWVLTEFGEKHEACMEPESIDEVVDTTNSRLDIVERLTAEALLVNETPERRREAIAMLEKQKESQQ